MSLLHHETPTRKTFTTFASPGGPPHVLEGMFMNTVRTSWSTISITGSPHPENTRSQSSAAADSDELFIDERSREVRLEGLVVDLTKTEFDLLHILASHPRQVFTSQQLFQRVWSAQYFEADHVIETHISRLRRKLGESGSNPRYIHTVRGVGYRFEPNKAASRAADRNRDAPSPDRLHIQLSPNLTVTQMDPQIAELLGVDAPECVGLPISVLMRALIATSLRRFFTRPVRDSAGALVAIELEIQPTSDGQPMSGGASDDQTLRYS